MRGPRQGQGLPHNNFSHMQMSISGMSFLKSAGLLGAGAYGYHHIATDDSWRSILPRLPYLSDSIGSIGTKTSSSDGPHIRALQGEVDRLSSMLTESLRQRQYAVIHGGRSSAMFWVYAMACLGGVGLYCKWRGIGLMDLLFVSQGAMQQFKASVSQGLSKLWEEMRKQKDEMVKKLTGVSTRQDQMMDKQQQMDERLKQVGENVDDVKVNTHRISSRVSMLDNRLADVAQGVGTVQQGVLLLCHTVAEVTARIGMPQNTRSQQALKGFLGGAGLMSSSGQGSGSINSSGQLLPLPVTEPSAFLEDEVAIAQVTTKDLAQEEVRSRSFSGPPSFPHTKASQQSTPLWSVFGVK